MNKSDEKFFKQYLSDINKNMNEDFGETNLELFWATPPFIFSKKLFKNGDDLKKFINNVFGFEFRPYVYKSRAILLGRLLKKINNLSRDECALVSNKLVMFSKEHMDIIYGDDITIRNINTNQKVIQSDFFSDWSNYLKK